MPRHGPRARTSATTGQTRTMLVGLVTLALFAGAFAVALVSDEGLPFRPYTYVTAAFEDAGGLRVGDDVRENSVRVGQVDNIAYRDGRAEVRLKLDGDRAVHRDARAQIWDRSPLGQKFVALDTGTSGAGPLGGTVIATDRNRSTESLDHLLDVFDPPTRTAVTGLVREVGGGAAGHGKDLNDAVGAAPHLLTDLGTVSDAATADDARFVEMLRRADTLSSRFTGHQQQIASLTQRFDRTVRALAVDEGVPLARTMDRLPGTLRTAKAGFDAVNPPLGDLERAMTALRPGASALGEATPDLRGVLREGVVPLRKVPGVARQAEPAVRDLTGVMADARPLAPDVAEALDSAREPLEVLAPYSPEVALWFAYFRSALSESEGSSHWLRMSVIANTQSVLGSFPREDPLLNREPYPSPGEAQNQTAGGAP